ncbi:MAG: SDR family oxidoreductase [Ilumatobacter sp.]|nr:SDR family oxidoreductase [Ilumatobacter sp.]
MARYPFSSALITGASSGIGEVMARKLAGAGVPTVVIARRADRLEAIAEEFDDVEVITADLTTESGQLAAAARIADDDRPIDLVVNNAGFGSNGLFHELDADRIADEVELNVAALTRLSHAALAAMVPRERGWLLNVSSVASFQPAPRLAVYAATKAYVTSLSESLHEEVKPHGVHVTALCPGLTKTEFQSVSNTEQYADEFPGVAWTSPELVVDEGLDSVVANRALAVPGTQYKVLTAAANVTPRWVKRRMSALVQRS